MISMLMHRVVQLSCRPIRVSVITAMGTDSHCLPAHACCRARLIARVAPKKFEGDLVSMSQISHVVETNTYAASEGHRRCCCSVLLGGVLSCTSCDLRWQAQAWGKSY